MKGSSLAIEVLVRVAREQGLWFPLEVYLHEYRGETKEAVYARRSKSIWLDGVHCKFVKGAGLWINLLAVNEWVAKSELRPESPAAKTRRERAASASPSCSATSSAASD